VRALLVPRNAAVCSLRDRARWGRAREDLRALARVPGPRSNTRPTVRAQSRVRPRSAASAAHSQTNTSAWCKRRRAQWGATFRGGDSGGGDAPGDACNTRSYSRAEPHHLRRQTGGPLPETPIWADLRAHCWRAGTQQEAAAEQPPAAQRGTPALKDQRLGRRAWSAHRWRPRRFPSAKRAPALIVFAPNKFELYNLSLFLSLPFALSDFHSVLLSSPFCDAAATSLKSLVLQRRGSLADFANSLQFEVI